jgi:hypothetical protein
MANLRWDGDDFRNPQDSSGATAGLISRSGKLQQGYNHSSIESGLRAYFPMISGSGSTLQDETNLGNNGSINGASWTSGKVGDYSLSFDGNDYVGINCTGPDLKNWTVSAWLRKDDWSGSGLEDWASAQDDYTSNSTKPLDFYWDSGNITHRRGGAAGEVLSADVSSKSGWIHAAVTQRRISSSEVRLTLYINGIRKDSNIGDYENMRPSDALDLGRAFTDEEYFTGKIDDFRLYERKISQPEVSTLANITNPSIISPGDTLQ